MFGAIGRTLRRSVLITRITLRIIFAQDPELLLFPGIVVLIVGCMAYGGFAVASASAGPLDLGPGQPLLFGLAFGALLAPLAATLADFCVTHTARVRLEGGNASFWQSVGYGLRNLGLVLLWMLASVGAWLVLGGLRRGLRKFGSLGELISRPLMWVLETAWSVSKLLVVPAMVYEGHRPLEAIKASAAAIRKTWGEAVVRELSFAAVFGGIQTVLVVLLVIFLFAAPLGSWLQMGGLGIVSVLLLVTLAISRLVNTVFNAALYHYATRGQAGLGFDADTLRASIRSKQTLR